MKYRLLRLSWGLAACGLLSCAASTQADPVRYRQALQKRLDGQTAAYYREMVELAASSPSSRGGRRAQAILAGNRWVGDLAMLSTVAANLAPPGPAATPAPAASEAQQSEAKQTLLQIAQAQKQCLQRRRRYCKTFLELGIQPPAKAHYFYFMGGSEVAGGSDSQTTVELEGQIRELLRRRHIEPAVHAKRFYCVAAGTNEDASALDAWAIDERGQLKNLRER